MPHWVCKVDLVINFTSTDGCLQFDWCHNLLESMHWSGWIIAPVIYWFLNALQTLSVTDGRFSAQFKKEINNVLEAFFVLLTSRQTSLSTLWQICLHLFLTINQWGECCGCQQCSSVHCGPSLVTRLRGSLQAWQQPWISIRFAEMSIENTCALEQESIFFPSWRKKNPQNKLDSDFMSLMTNIFKSTEHWHQDFSFSTGYGGRMQRENTIQVPQFPQIIIIIILKKIVNWIERKTGFPIFSRQASGFIVLQFFFQLSVGVTFVALLCRARLFCVNVSDTEEKTFLSFVKSSPS